jgi:hypothetical protein
MHNNCKCPHHIVNKVLMLLAWVAGILFFWGGLAGRDFWGLPALYWGWSVVVLVLLTQVSKACGCCKWGMKMGDKVEGGKMMCSHESGCKCGDCGMCK